MTARAHARLVPVVDPYSDGRLCEITARSGGAPRTERLLLHYELDGDAVSDDWDWDEASPRVLLDSWMKRYGQGELVGIHWFVVGPTICETATPPASFPEAHTFTDYYRQPVDATTRRPVDVIGLPVIEKRWDAGRQDKGGFLTLATGWRPSVFQPSVPTVHLRRLAAGRTFHLPRGASWWEWT